MAKRRFRRSAASWIGVSGFLISCAMRRATSAQAALRCADCSSVMSSKVTTKPSVRSPDRSAPMRTSSMRRAVRRPDLDLLRVRAVPASSSRRAAVRRIPAPRRPAARRPRRQQVDAEQLVGGAVRQLDAAVRVEADHAGRHAGQHRFGEPPAFVDLAVGLHQLAALRGKLAGHAVERARQRGDLVAARHLGDAHAQIAAAHPFGGVDQRADRPRDLVGQHQADQHGGQQHQQRDDGEDPGEGDLQPGPVLRRAAGIPATACSVRFM